MTPQSWCVLPDALVHEHMKPRPFNTPRSKTDVLCFPLKAATSDSHLVIRVSLTIPNHFVYYYLLGRRIFLNYAFDNQFLQNDISLGCCFNGILGLLCSLIWSWNYFIKTTYSRVVIFFRVAASSTILGIEGNTSKLFLDFVLSFYSLRRTQISYGVIWPRVREIPPSRFPKSVIRGRFHSTRDYILHAMCVALVTWFYCIYGVMTCSAGRFLGVCSLSDP